MSYTDVGCNGSYSGRSEAFDLAAGEARVGSVVLYRLPTEAECEYACRGGRAGERYCGGDDPDALAWYKGNSGKKTHPVGQKRPNGLALYDMSGNVYEWTCSVYHERLGGAEQRCAGREEVGQCAYHGGSWLVDAKLVRAAARSGYRPDFRANYLGLRLARDAR